MTHSNSISNPTLVIFLLTLRSLCSSADEGNRERMLPKDMQLCSGVNGVWTQVHLTPGPWSSLQIIRSKDWSRNSCKWRMVFSVNEAGQCDSHLASVLVIYWHVTVFPQTCTLLQNTLIFLLFFFFAMPRGMWDFGSLTRDQTYVSFSGSLDS